MTGFEILTPTTPFWLLAVPVIAGVALFMAIVTFIVPEKRLSILQALGVLLGLFAILGISLFLWNGEQERLTDALHAEVNEHYNVTIDDAEVASDTTQVVNLTDADGTQHLATLQIKDGRATLYTSQTEEWPT